MWERLSAVSHAASCAGQLCLPALSPCMSGDYLSGGGAATGEYDAAPNGVRGAQTAA